MSFYYSADGKKFYSKVEALEYKTKSGVNIGLYYHDDVYSKVDWKTEPPGTLDFYYKEQAQRLRDTYDYLILCYSGGYDSTNILETFFYNNIKLDKIVIVGAFSQDSYIGSDENHNGELYYNAFPLIEKLGLQSITEVHDYTEKFNKLSDFSITSYANEWADYTGAWYSPHHWFWRDIEKNIIPTHLGSKKVGIIFGKDKPNLLHNKFHFQDSAAFGYGNIQSTSIYDVINFYWDPNFTPILLKQLHVLKNLGAYNPHAIEDHIYNLKNPLLFKSGKSRTSLLSLRDHYIFKKQNSDIYDFYISGITRMNSKIDIRSIRPVHSVGYSVV